MSGIGRFAEPEQSLLDILGNPETVQTHARQAILGFNQPLFCGSEVEIGRLLMELRDTETVFIHLGQRQLRIGITLIGTASEPVEGLGIIRNTPIDPQHT